ncbi:N-acetylglucosamine-6-phosphate deacetylase [Synechococcus sp. CBW1004]|uniref:N-acetylglucosamine-6-phosphate deacetylase n=1 Tax=Synechococcus sp. CBW1004 TaxID=1353136 RepID=UPI00351BB4BE
MPWLTNVRLPLERACGHDRNRLWRIGVDDAGVIAALEPLDAGSHAAGIDWGGDWLSPMGVDLQINGGLGLAFPELTPADLPRLEQLLERLWADGVEAICPTLVTCGVEPLRQALAVLAEARRRHRSGRCRLLGAHLEGPFLAYERRGAHPAEHLAAPSLEALAERIGGLRCGPGWEQPDDIALVTLAPELAGSDAVIRALRDRGAVVSLGHSAANEAQAQAAFDAGVSMLTHALNAMPDMHRRAPGPVAAALLQGDVALGLIADGVHVAPTMAVLLQRLAPDRVVIVSDALAPYGLEDGVHRWDERELHVSGGSCRLADGTLAGVTLPLLEGAVRLARWSGRPERAIAAATVLPRRVLGEQRSLPQLLVGRPLGETLRWRQGKEGLQWRQGDHSEREP